MTAEECQLVQQEADEAVAAAQLTLQQISDLRVDLDELISRSTGLPVGGLQNVQYTLENKVIPDGRQDQLLVLTIPDGYTLQIPPDANITLVSSSGGTAKILPPPGAPALIDEYARLAESLQGIRTLLALDEKEADNVAAQLVLTRQILRQELAKSPQDAAKIRELQESIKELEEDLNVIEDRIKKLKADYARARARMGEIAGLLGSALPIDLVLRQ